MKKIYLLTLAAALFAACSSDDLAVKEQPQVQAEEGVVAFDAYMQRATTRGGDPGVLTTNTDATVKLTEKGFGVFGYYTDNRDYDQLATPNFMYNTKVSTAAWTYEPVMYWPNEYGDNAISDDNDKVTFFAYAPYVEVVPTTGKLNATAITNGDDKWGITEMSRNTAAGDPIVKYIASFKSAEAVDLCWGVCQQSDWALVQDGKAQTLGLGKPWINVERPAGVDQKLKFQFKHATAKMNIKINEFTDEYKENGGVDSKTRIWIRSVRFTGFTMKGALNLNNEQSNKPYWMNYNGIGDLVADGDVIVYDGRKDGKEAVGEATNEKSKGLNPQFIEDNDVYNYGTTTTWQTKVGVTETLTNLFEASGDFFVIPTGDPMQIEIVYDVETIDPNLGTVLADGKTKGSHIENRITKDIQFGNGVTNLEAGKAYEIKLHLGMNSVKFDAEVVDWDKMASPDIDLPANMPAYKAETTASTPSVDIAGADATYVFAVTGLEGGENVTATGPFGTYKVSSDGDFTTEENRANASGVAYIQVTVSTSNASIKDKLTSNAVTVTGTVSGKSTKLQITQKAQPLGLTDASVFGATWTLASTTNTDWSDLLNGAGIPPLNSEEGIQVWCDGALLTVVKDAPPASEKEVQLDWSAGTLTFKTDRTNGQIVKLYLKAGDVPAETITFNYNGGKQ